MRIIKNNISTQEKFTFCCCHEALLASVIRIAAHHRYENGMIYFS